MFRFPLLCKAKSLLSVLFILLLSHATNSFAHAVVTDSSLREHPVQPQTATTVVLYFSSTIEVSLSKVFLVSKGNVREPLKIKTGSTPREMLIYLPPLAEGEYALHYKVFATDGHLTENVLPFHISPPH
jgi:hypothetical protein